jgi:hypothetical protein
MPMDAIARMGRDGIGVAVLELRLSNVDCGISGLTSDGGSERSDEGSGERGGDGGGGGSSGRRHGGKAMENVGLNLLTSIEVV